MLEILFQWSLRMSVVYQTYVWYPRKKSRCFTDRASERRKHMPRATFLKAHWSAIAAMDFFKVELMTLIGSVRYSVIVVMDLKTRHVEVAGIVRGRPTSSWIGTQSSLPVFGICSGRPERNPFACRVANWERSNKGTLRAS